MQCPPVESSQAGKSGFSGTFRDSYRGVHEQRTPGSTCEAVQKAREGVHQHVDGGPQLPQHGGALQENVYSLHLRSLRQHLLVRAEGDLRNEGLGTHPGKTQYVCFAEGEQEAEIAGKKVKGVHQGTLTVLGTPIALDNEISQVASVIARRPVRHMGKCSDEWNARAYGKLVTLAALWAAWPSARLRAC